MIKYWMPRFDENEIPDKFKACVTELSLDLNSIRRMRPRMHAYRHTHLDHTIRTNCLAPTYDPRNDPTRLSPLTWQQKYSGRYGHGCTNSEAKRGRGQC